MFSHILGALGAEGPNVFWAFFFLLANLNVLPLIRYSPDVYKFPLGEVQQRYELFLSQVHATLLDT